MAVWKLREYRKLAPQPEDLVAFLRCSPLAEALSSGELELVRSRDLARDIPV